MALDHVPAKVPRTGEVLSVVLQMSTFGVLVFFLTRRTNHIKNWRQLPPAQWLILGIYVDSALFVLTTSIIVHGFGINSSKGVCEGGILLCLVCYMTTKILVYYFLVERAYIVGGNLRPRLKTKLWLFNCLFMLLPYTIFVIMNFVFRITYINEAGVCIIGMQYIAMLPLITFEVIVNVYLTALFILPLRSLPSYKSRSNPALHRMAFRSFVGSCATLTTSVANLTVLMVLKGEPGWICLMCCNADILFCAIVLQWVSSKEQKDEASLARLWGGSAGTIGRNRDPSRRVSAIVCDTMEAKKHGISVSAAGRYPKAYSAPPSTIVAECKGCCRAAQSALIAVLQSREACGGMGTDKSVGEDELELRNIRVEKAHAREVESERETRRWTSMEGDDEWMASRKGVVGERMV